MMTKKHDALSAWAESDTPTIRPEAAVLRGDAASKAARDLLAAAAEDPADAAAVARAAGRPALDPTTPGKSPVWQLRAPQDLDARVRALASAQGRSVSAVLRDAASEYLTRHAS